jgi:hypothetical protein
VTVRIIGNVPPLRYSSKRRTPDCIPQPVPCPF